MSNKRSASAYVPVLISGIIGGYFILEGLGITSIAKWLVPPWVVVGLGLVVFLFGLAFSLAALTPENITAGGAQGYLTILPEERPSGLIKAWVFTVIWNMFIGIFWFLVLSGARGEGSIWVAYVVLGIFTPIGLGMLYSSIKLTLSAARFGYIPLHLQADKARAGQTFTGQIVIPRHDVLKTVVVKLICYKVVYQRVQRAKGGSSVSQSRTEHWSGINKNFPVGPDGSVAIQGKIPADLPGTTASLKPDYSLQLGTDYYAWMLEVEADVPGVDLYRTYEVPVQQALPGFRDEVLPDSGIAEKLSAEDVAHKTAAVRTIALADLSAGNTIDAVVDKLTGMGNAPAIIAAGLQQIAADPASPYRDSAQVWLAHQSRMQAEMNAGQLLLLDRPAVPQSRQTQDTPEYSSASSSKQISNQPSRSRKTIFIVNVVIILIIGAYFYTQYQQGNERIHLAEQQNTQERVEAQDNKATMHQRSSGYQIAPAPIPLKFWDGYYNKAVAAKQQGNLQGADRLFQEALNFIEQTLGPDHPAAARTLATRADLYRLQKKPADYEQAMLKSYAILDRYTNSEIQTALDSTLYAIDKEMVARDLGDYYWDAYRYADSFKYYELAYQAAPGLETTDYSRNLKLALSSAGVMKTACMLGKWDLADKAMVELKQRYKSVEPESQKYLDYWIKTGEPRLKNRKC